MPLLVFKRHLASVWPPRGQQDRYCSTGGRLFFERHGWDWGHFLRHGLDAEKFLSTGDAMAIKAAQNALEEASRGR